MPSKTVLSRSLNFLTCWVCPLTIPRTLCCPTAHWLSANPPPLAFVHGSIVLKCLCNFIYYVFVTATLLYVKAASIVRKGLFCSLFQRVCFHHTEKGMVDPAVGACAVPLTLQKTRRQSSLVPRFLLPRLLWPPQTAPPSGDQRVCITTTTGVPPPTHSYTSWGLTNVFHPISHEGACQTQATAR